MRIGDLERFGLTESSFRHLGSRKVEASIHLRTYDLTRAIRKLPPSKRFAYMAARAEGWIQKLRSRYPGVLFRVKDSKVSTSDARGQRPPSTLLVHGSAHKILKLACLPETGSVWLTKVGSRRPRPAKHDPQLGWYCVRALVVIRIEGETSGAQATEDRFVLVRALSFEDATKRLRRQWREYARPYLNSDGRMVSWQLDHVVDVYFACETDIDPAGTEVYSKLYRRRMRPKYVWRPKC